MKKNEDRELSFTLEEVFGDAVFGWGRKYPQNARLVDIWKNDRDYLLWACSLKQGRDNPGAKPPPLLTRRLIEIVCKLEGGDIDGGKTDFQSYRHWKEISQEGKGIELLPRPTKEECLEIFEKCSLLAGHSDLDGIYSLAIALSSGHALGFKLGSESGTKIPFRKLRLLGYSFRNLDDYTETLAPEQSDIITIIDFSAHPLAALNLDHHTTSLSYWEIETEIPRGIYDPSMPSCPRLLATHCGLEVSEEILSGCDLIDGALYTSVEQASDLENPFVALAHVLDLDVSDTIAKKVVITLAQSNLDPYSVLENPTWKARLQLLRLEIEEQRSYWSKKNRFSTRGPHLALADARRAPYSPNRFRFLPFEHDNVVQYPYLLTLRGTRSPARLSIGLSRNPFYRDKEFFAENLLDIGSLMRSIAGGGGRREVGSAIISSDQLNAIVQSIEFAIMRSVAVQDAVG